MAEARRLPHHASGMESVSQPTCISAVDPLRGVCACLKKCSRCHQYLQGLWVYQNCWCRMSSEECSRPCIQLADRFQTVVFEQPPKNDSPTDQNTFQGKFSYLQLTLLKTTPAERALKRSNLECSSSVWARPAHNFSSHKVAREAL